MNVTEPKLLPSVYGRANYLKREIMAMARYGQQRREDKKTVLAAFMADALDFINDRLGTSASVPLPATSTVVTDGAVLGPFGGENFTITVAGGVVTNIVAAPAA